MIKFYKKPNLQNLRTMKMHL